MNDAVITSRIMKHLAVLGRVNMRLSLNDDACLPFNTEAADNNNNNNNTTRERRLFSALYTNLRGCTIVGWKAPSQGVLPLAHIATWAAASRFSAIGSSAWLQTPGTDTERGTEGCRFCKERRARSSALHYLVMLLPQLWPYCVHTVLLVRAPRHCACARLHAHIKELSGRAPETGTGLSEQTKLWLQMIHWNCGLDLLYSHLAM